MVDFQDIEGESEARQTGFERSTRDKLAGSIQSPREHMIEEEEAIEEEKRKIQKLRRLRRFAKYAGLTYQQWECYKLYFLTKRQKKVRLRQLARKLGISIPSVWHRLDRVIRKIEKVQDRYLEGQKLKKLLKKPLYASKLKKVFHLYFERGWPPKKTAQSLDSSLSSIYKNIHTIRWLAAKYSSE